MPESSLRRKRLLIVFEGRKTQLEQARKAGAQQGYGKAVFKYIRARKSWRHFRGWS